MITVFIRSKDRGNRFSDNPARRRLRVVHASLQQIKGQQSAYSAPAARGAATPGLRPNPEGKTGKILSRSSAA